MTKENFEETQFFSTQYDRGLEWYLGLFDAANNASIDDTRLVMEKSANYFAHPHSPRRLRALLGETNVKLAVVTIDPIRRAYSWYQVIKLVYLFILILENKNLKANCF